MHYYQFNPSDFKAKTRHLTHLERAFYRELIDLYYETEKPITGDLPKLERLLLAKTDDEKQALLSVLDEFFVFKNDAYHDFEITAKIRAYKWADKKRNAQGTQNGTPSGTQAEQNGTQNGTDKERKQRHKNKVNYLRALLSDHNIQTPANSSITLLTDLCNEHKIAIDWDMVERQAEQNGTQNGTQAEQNGTPKNERITNNHKPITNNQEPNINKESASASKKFTKPSFEQVRDYFTELKHNNPSEQASIFLDFYDSNGWKVGRNPMKDWQATVRNWIKRDGLGQQNKQENYNATHQRTPKINPAEEYYNNAMAEYERYYGSASQSTTGQDFAGNVYDVEAAI